MRTRPYTPCRVRAGSATVIGSEMFWPRMEDEIMPRSVWIGDARTSAGRLYVTFCTHSQSVSGHNREVAWGSLMSEPFSHTARVEVGAAHVLICEWRQIAPGQ